MAKRLLKGFLTSLPDNVETAWGGQSQLSSQHLFHDLFQSEQSYFFDNEKEMRSLLLWCTTVGFAKLERVVSAEFLIPGDHRRVEVESRRFLIVAGPKGTDFLHVTAYLKSPATPPFVTG